MLNDTILAGLINLFALLGAKSDAPVERSRKLLDDYLRRHFGLRNTGSYLDLYDDLRSLYDAGDTIDKDSIVEQICSNIKGKISQGERTIMLLRLMEFCNVASDKAAELEYLFRQIAEHFSVEEGLFADFLDFVLDRESEKVHHQSFKGYDGEFKTLWIPTMSTLVFTYYGTDEVLFDDMPLLAGVFQVWHKSGVLKNSKGAPVYYSSAFLPYEDKSGEGITYCARDLNFRFPNTDAGLHNFSFDLHSGELVAIMGGSGTGKTTLLSILNGSLIPQEGSMSINGRPVSDPQVKELIGFVPQDDLLVEELTVYQNLWYTGKLCFDSISSEELDRKVMKVLQELCLDHIKDLVVGSPLNKTISGGQRKRVNIALELIREPAVLFLDEPTSGLSSADTENVMGLLKDQTNKGCLVVVNIHQPSSDVYKLFDRLWLLDKGGYPVFDGNPIDAVTYFKRQANYADAETSTCHTCGNVNPEIILNIIDEKSLDNSGMPSSERKTSPQQWHEMYLGQRKEFSAVQEAPVPASGQKKPGFLKQFSIFLERNLKAKLTNRQYLIITLLEAPLLALICGFLTRFAPVSGYTVMDNKNMVIYLFMAVIVATFLGMSGSAEEIIKDRALLKREKYLSLSYGSYILSKIAFAAICALIQTSLFIVIGNLLMGIHGMFLMWWIILFVTYLLSSLIGLLLSQCLNSVVSIYISIPLLLIPQILLCGLVVDFSDLNSKSTTGNVPVIGDVIPSRWSFEALAVGSFCNNRYERPYFELDQRRYEALFYRDGLIEELESQMETMENKLQNGEKDVDKYVDVVKKNLPKLYEVTGMEYKGEFEYAPVMEYLEEAKSKLAKEGNSLTLKKDRMVTERIAEIGSEAMSALKRDNFNLKLESVLTGEGADGMLKEVDGYLVPQMGAVYLTPSSRNGRAPFYSSMKMLGNVAVPTVWFNLAVLLIMCILLATALFADLPDKLKKQY